MGREIRRVIPNWEHPKKENGGYHPMYDSSASERFDEWLKEFEDFKINELEDACKEYGYDINDPYSAFCEYCGTPPNHNYYRPKWDKAEATWWQVYETVSEGTPVSPPFATPEELIDYLVEHGDFWDQKRRADGRTHLISCDPWSREAAEVFVKGSGWSPTGMLQNGKYYESKNIPLALKNAEDSAQKSAQ